MTQQQQHHHHEGSFRRLTFVLVLVLVILVAEVLGGIFSNSLALLGDAGHMLVDALALGLTLFAIVFARKPATATRTFGYYRVEIFAALINGATLIVVAGVIIYEAYQRFRSPPEIHTTLMLIVAGIGLVANLVGILLLRAPGGKTLNVKAAFWHVIGDTISSVGVLAAGAIIAFTGWTYADPIIAVVISLIILWGAISVVKESVDILLEAAPRNLKIDEIVNSIKDVGNIIEVHDLHVWTITSNLYALSAHLVVNDQPVSGSASIIEAVNERLKKLNIAHTTFQVECNVCASGMVCEIGNPESFHSD